MSKLFPFFFFWGGGVENSDLVTFWGLGVLWQMFGERIFFQKMMAVCLLNFMMGAHDE